MNDIIRTMENAHKEIKDHVEQGIIPFWLNNSIDKKFGGYFTCFDENGKHTNETDKYIVTQTRMIWGLSAFYGCYPENSRLCKAAVQGIKFFIDKFWDNKYGGWYWRTKRNGKVCDNGKVVYGQSFAIYALTEYTLATGDIRGLEYAEKTFDLLQKYCADTLNGGYFENLENDWSISEPGLNAGDRKSLDIHMHLMEAFTKLADCSGKEIHQRKLKEIMDIITGKMLNLVAGCAMNQFTTDFKPIPAINIRRTWNAERVTGELVEKPMDTTSYGHNVELVWLLNRAADVLEMPKETYSHITRSLVDHSLKFGFDYELGGVYRDGPHDGPAIVEDKEWWQNCEVLVGYLDAFERLGDEKYLKAFLKTWEFDKKYMINWEVGEWRQLLDKCGNIIAGDIGNPWKAIYHTGRAMLECMQRLERLINRFEPGE
ncbi:MAG: AGE family epimerase/isomerase [Clostridia bacterium]|nr:AGE family epimerase/isomerase [Clostridia bacterium]